MQPTRRSSIYLQPHACLELMWKSLCLPVPLLVELRSLRTQSQMRPSQMTTFSSAAVEQVQPMDDLTGIAHRQLHTRNVFYYFQRLRAVLRQIKEKHPRYRDQSQLVVDQFSFWLDTEGEIFHSTVTELADSDGSLKYDSNWPLIESSVAQRCDSHYGRYCHILDQILGCFTEIAHSLALDCSDVSIQLSPPLMSPVRTLIYEIPRCSS